MDLHLSPLTPEIMKARRDGMSRRELAHIVRGVDLAFEPPEFNIITDAPLVALFQSVGDAGLNLLEGEPVIKGTTSSTDTDLYGSRMASSAVEAMRKDGATHLTTFLNHDYTIPESILGSMTSATTAKRRGNDGVMYTDLDLVSSVVGEDVNTRALQCWRSIKGGVKLGFSIGALVLEWEWQLPDGTTLKTDTDDDWNMYCPPTEDAVLTYTDVMLLESSLVGVPANRRSWVHSANRSMAKAARAWQIAQVRQFSGARVGTTAADTGATLARLGAADDMDTLVGISALRKELAENGETMTDLLRQIQETRKADSAAKDAQKKRSEKYNIGVKNGGNVTKPSEFSDVPDDEWGDPVNYRYPMPDKEHADNAASRWGDEANKKGYTEGEQKIIGDRIAARQAHFGEKEDKSMDETSELPPTVSLTAPEDALLVAPDTGAVVTDAVPASEPVHAPAEDAPKVDPVPAVVENTAPEVAEPSILGPIVSENAAPAIPEDTVTGPYVAVENATFTASYDWPADDTDASASPAVIPPLPSQPPASVALAAPDAETTIDPFALLTRSITLVDAHVARSGTELHADHAVSLRAAYDNMTSLLVRYKVDLPKVAAAAPEESLIEATPDLLRQMREERAAGEHILKSLREQIEAEKLNLALHRAAGEDFQTAVRRAEQVPFGRPTERYADTDVTVTDSVEARYARAEAEVAAR